MSRSRFPHLVHPHASRPAALSATASQLLHDVEGEVFFAGEERMSRLLQQWGWPVWTEPAFLVLCKHEHDATAAARLAHSQGMPVWGRLSPPEPGSPDSAAPQMLIEVGRCRRVHIDAASRVASAEGGATLGDVLLAAAEHELALPLGGGGLDAIVRSASQGRTLIEIRAALGRLLGVELIRPDGRKVSATVSENCPLLDSVRDGAHAAGVVISMRLQLHQLMSG